jgi:hypothetical protein
MASPFIPPLDQNPSSPSSKRRRNAALSCAECRRYPRFLALPCQLAHHIYPNKAQVEVRTCLLFVHFHFKPSSPLADVAVSFPALAASRKAVPQYAQKVSTKYDAYPGVMLTGSTQGP